MSNPIFNPKPRSLYRFLKRCSSDWTFYAALAAWFAGGLFLLPYLEANLYLPFLESWARHPASNPWTAAVLGGAPEYAFPYGIVQLAAFAPAILMIKAGANAHIAYALTLGSASLAASFFFSRSGKSARASLMLGFANPAVVLSAIFFGTNDVLAVDCLLLSFLFLSEKKLFQGALWLLAAASCKLSLLLVLPFFFVYCHKLALNDTEKKQLLIGLLCGMLFFAALPPSGWAAIFSNPETVKTLSLAIPFRWLSQTLLVPVLPLVWLLWLYSLWNKSFLTFKLYCAMAAGGLFLTSLLTPGNFGWLLWSLPGFAFCGVEEKAKSKTYILFSVFLAFALLESLIVMRPASATPLALSLGLPDPAEWFPEWVFAGGLFGLAKAASLAFGLVILLRYRKMAFLANDPFNLESKSALILIAGDSGSGKDTLSDSIRAAFPGNFSASVSGDDYHLWDRGKGMWQALTHLNPFANDLASFHQDVVKLRNGAQVRNRHYNHDKGVKGDLLTLRPSTLVVASGLHALHMDQLNGSADLRIYLDTDEDLRIKLKVERDTCKRGHTLEKIMDSLQKREPDAEKYIRPQQANADVVFRLRPANPDTLRDRPAKDVKLALEAKSKLFGNEAELRRVLCGVCGLQLEVERDSDGTVSLYVEGEFSHEDALFAAKLLCPSLSEHFEPRPEPWPSGIAALMQVLALMSLEIQLRKRAQ